MSLDEELTTESGPPSFEELGHRLYSREHLKYHTEINKPDPMTIADTYAEYVGTRISKSVGQIYKGHLKNYRDNMVAFKRKRAGETERMVQANNATESTRKTFKELMIGTQR